MNQNTKSSYILPILTKMWKVYSYLLLFRNIKNLWLMVTLIRRTQIRLTLTAVESTVYLLLHLVKSSLYDIHEKLSSMIIPSGFSVRHYHKFGNNFPVEVFRICDNTEVRKLRHLHYQCINIGKYFFH